MTCMIKLHTKYCMLINMNSIYKSKLVLAFVRSNLIASNSLRPTDFCCYGSVGNNPDVRLWGKCR